MKILITVKISDEQFKKIQDLGYDVVRISESKVTNSSETDDADILVCYNPFKTLDIEKIEKSFRDEVIIRQIRLDQRSLGRLLQPERSEQQSLRKRSR